MITALKVIGWALLGALIAGILSLIGFILFFGPKVMLGPGDSDELQAWSWFATSMASAGIAAGGLVIGAIWGIVRAVQGKTPPVKPAG
jgi:hypothetical protein